MTLRLKSLSSTSVLAMYWWVQPSAVSAAKTKSRIRGRRGVTFLCGGGNAAGRKSIPRGQCQTRLASPRAACRGLSGLTGAERVFQLRPARRELGRARAFLAQARAQGVGFERHAGFAGVEQRGDRARLRQREAG